MSLPRNSNNPTLSEVIDNTISVRLMALHTGLPARITEWDASKQLCTVQPLIQKITINENNEPVFGSYQLIASVPFVFPGNGVGGITWPVQVGDLVWLQFSEACLDSYMQTGDQSQPTDAGRFELSGAVATPGPRPFPAPVPNVSSSHWFFGNHTAERGFAAMAEETTIALNNIVDAINGLILPVSGVSAGPTATPIIVDTNVASTTVKLSK